MFFDKERHLAVRLATWEAHMAEKEYGLTLKTFPQPCSFSVKLGRCNLEVPYTFLDPQGP